MTTNLKTLRQRRRRLLLALTRLGDFHRGSLAVIHRRCGRACCQCLQPGHPGHGPHYLLTWKESGRGRSRAVRPGADLLRVKRQLANHRRFRLLVRQLRQVSEQACRLRSL